MNRSSKAARAVAVIAAIAVVLGVASAASPASASSPRSSVTQHYTPAGCATPQHAGDAVCHATVWTPGTDHVLRPHAGGPPPSALGPADIQSAYDLPAAGGGQTVAIVDAYGYADAEADLAVFRSEYGLPPCTTANGCFTKLDQRGGTDYPRDDAGWALETALDLDAVSAACPSCNLLLVEGDDANVDSLGEAVDTAVDAGAKFVSNSYGVPGEFSDETDYDASYNHPGVAVTVSSGDTGNLTEWPAANPNVIAVGGTALSRDSSTARGWRESVWDGAGSGCSVFEPQPDYQLRLDVPCDRRAIADISADAAPETGLAVYSGIGAGGWAQVGGTSLSSPLVAAMYALAGAPPAGEYPVQDLYDPSHSGGYNDVTDGSNGSCGTVLCEGGPGWDGPTGFGTPAGVGVFRQGPSGTIGGTVTDAGSGAPVPGARIELSDGRRTIADGSGAYALSGVGVGSYDLSISAYGYAGKRVQAVRVADDRTTTVDVALRAVPSAEVTGTVLDGGAHHWPLYARIDIPGYPRSPIYTDPATGAYSVRLPRQSSYDVTVSPVYAGWRVARRTITLGAASSARADFRIALDAATCAAPGYGWEATTADFLQWNRQPREGWTIRGPGWRFDDPADRVPPEGGDNDFAIADAAYAGRSLRTALVSPRLDLTGQTDPVLTFDQRYLGAPGRSATVALSLDDGRTWTTISRRTDSVAVAPGRLSLAAAAGSARARVRFAFVSAGGGYWSIDNVLAGTRTCVARAGGLVLGAVQDASTRAGLPGARVVAADDPAHPARAIATTADPQVPDGFYWLFVPPGVHRLTAAVAGHVRATADVRVTAGGIRTRNWKLTPVGAAPATTSQERAR